METNDNQLPALIPERYSDHDLFICDVADAVLKDIMPNMEHPFYSLSKKPEMTIREYKHNGNKIEIIPSFRGLATIYDKDILIYCISQIMAKVKKGENLSNVSPRVRINSYDLLRFTNRGTSGKDYQALSEGLDRLMGMFINTNIRTGDEEQINKFNLIEAVAIRRKNGFEGRLLWCEIVLSDWVFNAIKHNEILTLHRDYFRLRKPIERRIYEIARKHCGQKAEWRIGLPLLLKKTGSKASEKGFRYNIRELVNRNHLPDYEIFFDAKKDLVIFTNRVHPRELEVQGEAYRIPLDPDIYGDARNVAPGWDLNYLENEWRGWLMENEIVPRYPENHFVKFCETWFEKRGRP